MTVELEPMEERPKTLEELYDYQVKFAAFAFVRNEGFIQPMWVGQTTDDTLLPITTTWDSAEQKLEAFETVKNIFRDFEVVRYVSMLEAWMVIADKSALKEDREGLMKTRPSDHPDKQEAIIIVGEDGVKSIFGYYPIIRDKDGNPTLGEFQKQDMGGAISSGTMTDLLPIKRNETIH